MLIRKWKRYEKMKCPDMNMSILLITHDEKTALMADRVITLEDGKILHDEVVG